MTLERVMEAATKDGLPRSSFAYTPSDEPSTWKLPYLTSGGAPDPSHLPGAAAALSSGGFRGQQADIPASAIPVVKAKLRQAYKRWGRDMPDSIREDGALLERYLEESVGEPSDDGIDYAIAEWVRWREAAGDEDHFYGTWRKGGTVSGGTMAKARATERRAKRNRARDKKPEAPQASPQASQRDAQSPEDIVRGLPEHISANAKPGSGAPDPGPVVSVDEAIRTLEQGGRPNIAAADVETFMQKAAARSDHLDLTELQVDGTLKFGGDGLGLARDAMPQLGGPGVLPKYVADLQSRGIAVSTGQMDPMELRPIQREVSAQKSGKLHGFLAEGTMRVPSGPNDLENRIVITQDNFVIDGHHRWGAYTAKGFADPNVRLDYVRLGLPAQEALKDAQSWTQGQGIATEGMTSMKGFTEAEYSDLIDAAFARYEWRWG